MPFNFLNQGQTDDAANKVQPIDTFIDPVSKIRVSNPANLIDTDFEYGLQPTKWETVEIINNTPAFFSKSGDTTISDITGITTNGGTREITVTTAFPHNLDVGIPIRVSGTKSLTADGSYIINATPTDTTFTYLCRANQPETISIFDLYSSIITGEFFQGSQISISDAEGMTTDGSGPNSTITIKTQNKHGFGPKTPFYFLNLNSTVSQEFESQNSTSLSFDPTNSATAQNFDGSNTLIQTPVDLSNSATTSEYENSIASTDPTASTITVNINSLDAANWNSLVYGSPLYYNVNIGSGYFQANPRGVVFIKSVDQIDTTNTQTATFQVSQVPDGDPLPILANMTGYFKIADQARTFAGNNVDPNSQIDITVLKESPIEFDASNTGYPGELDGTQTPPIVEADVVGYTGTNITLFTAEGSLEFYVGAMLQYTTTGTAATGLENNATYFVNSFSEGASAGLYNMTVSELPGAEAADITISGGSGVQSFKRIGLSIDKDIIHVRDANFDEGDMLQYAAPGTGSFVYDAEQQKTFFFVDVAYDAHNYKLNDAPLFTPMSATGGNFTTSTYDEGRIWQIHAFTQTGTFTVNTLGDDPRVDVLVVGGGGGGTGVIGGGGGAGGVVFTDLNAEGIALVEGTTYDINVGGGGLGGTGWNTSDMTGYPGQNSSAFGLVALGGGGGGRYGGSGQTRQINGGSGGGGSSSEPNGGTGLQPTSASGGFGNNGGGNATGDRGAGGGGAGGPGQPANGSRAGGLGIDLTAAFGTQIGDGGFFASGGGGGTRGGFGSGGIAYPGGGTAGTTNTTFAADAQANTGGGGGGAGYNGGSGSRLGGNGGSGIVLVKYPLTGENSNIPVVTGGEINSYIENNLIYLSHTFTAVGNSTLEVVDAPDGTLEAEVLVVGGGGGGGGIIGGGGGGGGFVEAPATLSVGTYTATVGDGGIGGRGWNFSPQNGVNGQNSSFDTIVALGGGYGGGHGNGTRGGDGGSAGGGGANVGGTGLQPASTSSGFGTNGGTGNGNQGGGGGGAGQAGLSANNGEGGDGKTSTFRNGIPTYYAGGGGGGGRSGSQPGEPGGLGGGGNGTGNTSRAQDGTDGLGGGGGGAGYSGESSSYLGGTGGSGVVVVRYPIGQIA